jgi:hypothetical protein
MGLKVKVTSNMKSRIMIVTVGFRTDPNPPFAAVSLLTSATTSHPIQLECPRLIYQVALVWYHDWIFDQWCCASRLGQDEALRPLSTSTSIEMSKELCRSCTVIERHCRPP